MSDAANDKPGSYRVLARKYRPSTFDDLIGQDAMVRTVSNAFEAGRIPQAWILTGVRGVGKTTTARILARALNYELPDSSITGPTINMPDIGVQCQAIMDSRHLGLIQLLARLPGLAALGRRAALFLIKKREAVMAPLASALQVAMEKIEVCKICGNIDTQNPCTVCTDARRDASAIVVVADVADLWALERAHAINARYHVLGGTLSPLDGVGPDDLAIDALVKRAHDPAVHEIILALNATVDGQSTAHYITDLLHDANVKMTRLAHGVPVGGELDYLDEGTLAAAIRSRTPF